MLYLNIQFKFDKKINYNKGQKLVFKYQYEDIPIHCEEDIQISAPQANTIKQSRQQSKT